METLCGASGYARGTVLRKKDYDDDWKWAAQKIKKEQTRTWGIEDLRRMEGK